MKHECIECSKRGKTWEGGDPVCAFDEYGSFNSSNWNCGTMNKLRDIAESDFHEGSFSFRDDMQNGSIGIIPLPDKCDKAGYLTMAWYKDRGTTSVAVIIEEGEQQLYLTEKIAEQIIEAWYPSAIEYKAKQRRSIEKVMKLDEKDKLYD